MKMKYLNPNTIFVASGVADGSPLDPLAPPPQLRAELLDSVTGGVLASFVHEVTFYICCTCCARCIFNK